MRVLIVDDKPQAVDVLQRNLSGKGLEILTATSGEQALRVLAECEEEGRPIGILASDYVMPGMHGAELLNRAIATNTDLYTIIFSAFHEQDYAVKALKVGADDFVNKGADTSIELEKAIRRGVRSLAFDRIGRDVLTQEDDEDVLELLFRSLLSMKRFDGFGLAARAGAGAGYFVERAVDLGNGEPLDGGEVPKEGSVYRHVIETGQVCFPPLFPAQGKDVHPHWETTRSFIAVPLQMQPGERGALGIEHKEAGGLRIDDLRFLNRVADYVSIAMERRRTLAENDELRAELRQRSSVEMIGESPAFRRDVLETIERMSKHPTDATVLIHGETGTGKELVARAIHQKSDRSGQRFLTINCAAFPDELLPSELFGHEKGAFTGADERKEGLFRAADGGTLFLDEIGETSDQFQKQLLRVLQEKEVLPLGATRPVKVDTRIVAATNRDLEREVEEGRFRQDLFYRLGVVRLRVPPLRDRVEDIPLLAEHFRRRFATDLGRDVGEITDAAMAKLEAYSWPGNIRELENVVAKTVLLHGDGPIDAEDVQLDTELAPSRSSESLLLEGKWSVAKAQFEKAYIERAFRRAGGVITHAAKASGMDRKNFRTKMNKHGLSAETPVVSDG